MLRRLRTGHVVALLGLALAASPADAADRRCEKNAAAESYLTQPVAGMTGAAIADYYLETEILPEGDENTRRFWQEFATSDKDVAALAAAWNASPDAKNAVIAQKQFIETMRQLRATIIAFEGTRPSPQQAAELLAGKWDDWRAKHMSREAFVSRFVSEASARAKGGLSAYGATLQAAQVLQNQLDTLHGAGGFRLSPEDSYRMWWWDFYVRQYAVADKVAALQAMKFGKAYWNSYAIDRTTTIKCVGANLKSSKVARAVAKAREIAREIEFPTAGYSNPKFFRAIYDGRTEGMRISQVGLYMAAFITMFTNADTTDCQAVVDKATLMRISGAGSVDILEKMLKGFLQAHSKQGGGRDEAFAQGFDAGAQTFGGMALNQASAQADAQLFYNRHGCDSDVANHFFGNVRAFAWK